jgi:hypothetical protein
VYYSIDDTRVIKSVGEDGEAMYRFGKYETMLLNLSRKISRK